MPKPHERGASKIHSMTIRVSEKAVELNLLKNVVPSLLQNRQLKMRRVVCSRPSYVVEALGRCAFIFHLSTSWAQSSKCSRGATYSKFPSTLQARLSNIIDLSGRVCFFHPKAFYWLIFRTSWAVRAYLKNRDASVTRAEKNVVPWSYKI